MSDCVVSDIQSRAKIDLIVKRCDENNRILEKS